MKMAGGLERRLDEQNLNDEEVLQINSQISRMTDNLKESVTLHLASARQRINNQWEAKLEQRERELQAEISRLSRLLGNSQNECARLRGILESEQQRLANNALELQASETMLCEYLQRNFFKFWMQRRKVLKYKNRVLEKWFAKTTRGLIAKQFRSWKCTASKKKGLRCEKAANAAWETKVVKIIHEYESTLKSKNDEIKKLKATVEEAEAARIQAEQQMKQAFMRSVSALNLEALQYFNTSVNVDTESTRMIRSKKPNIRSKKET